MMLLHLAVALLGAWVLTDDEQSESVYICVYAIDDDQGLK